MAKGERILRLSLHFLPIILILLMVPYTQSEAQVGELDTIATVTDTLYPLCDTEVKMAYPDNNYHDSDQLDVAWVGYNRDNEYRTWMKFDFSELPPDAQLDLSGENKVGLYCWDASNRREDITMAMPVPGTHWECSRITYNNQPELDDFDEVLDEPDEGWQWISNEFLWNWLQGWIDGSKPNDGFVLKMDASDNTYYQYRSTEYSLSSYWPRVIITYDYHSSVEDESPELPLIALLKQNYPNPFNAETTIEYALGEPSDVSIDIYNIVGQNIETLFSGGRLPGEYSVSWDASGYPSGIYFYKLTAGDFTETKRMTLLK